MKELKAKLKLHDDMDTAQVKAFMSDLTSYLLDNFKISNGKHSYSLLEIEYYIHTPLHSDMRANGAETVVYERPGKKAGDVFFHLSGLDICFEPDEHSFGGILIRSIVDESDPTHVIVGPCNCVVQLMNTASSIPHLIREKCKLKYSAPTQKPRVGLKSELPYAYNFKRKLIK